MSKAFRSVTHILFDMDGLLLDTEYLYTEAFQNILTKYGHEYTWDFKLQLMGLTSDQVAETVVDTLNLPIAVSEFKEMLKEQIETLMPDCKLMPGAEKLVRHLHRHKVPMAVATSSGRDSFDVKTRNHKEFFSLFNHIVTGGSDPEVKVGKPAPDIFLVCAARFKEPPHPDDCLVMEDSPNGVIAAVKAGMQVIMVPDVHVPLDNTKDATVVLQSLEDIKLDLFGLPSLR